MTEGEDWKFALRHLEWFEKAFMLSPLLMTIAHDSVTMRASPAYAQAMGYEPGELDGKSWLPLMWDIDGAKAEPIPDTEWETRKVLHLGLEQKTKAGEWVFIEWLIRRFRDSAGDNIAIGVGRMTDGPFQTRPDRGPARRDYWNE